MDSSTLVLIAVLVAVVAVIAFLAMRRGNGRSASSSSTAQMAKTSAALGSALRRAWAAGIDDKTWTEIEDALISADLGVEIAERVVKTVRSSKPESIDVARAELGRSLRSELGAGPRTLNREQVPSVLVVVGVNGSGKTTTIAKLAHRFSAQGETVVLGAADTFRAAAAEQLQVWGERLGLDVVAGQEGGDPASVAYDTVASGRAKGADVVIIDTAGRLHGKKNLMDELAKIHRVAASNGGVDEVLLVLDATSGQNGLAQVQEFAEAVPVSGVILTKLDGTAKGGIVIAVESKLEIPVKFIGVGEALGDLIPFDADSFVEELLEAS